METFGANAALFLIDVQKGVNDLAYYGGPTGRRNNPDAEDKQRTLLAAWRKAGLPVVWSIHESISPGSPLQKGLASAEQIEGLEPQAGEIVVRKDVNSAFIGTPLEVELRRAGITSLVIAGFHTNFCIETTTRMAGNLGYETYVVEDACATINRIGPDGTDYDPELVHNVSLASLSGEFCSLLTTAQALERLPG